MKKYFRCLVLVLCLGVLGFSQVKGRTVEPNIRVAIVRNQPSFHLMVKGPYSIRDESSTLLDTGSRLFKSKVRGLKGGIRLGDEVYRTKKLFVEGKRNSSIMVNNRRFEGKLIIMVEDGELTAINKIKLEDYVKGVLYHEVSHRWPIDAIKAQAVATRTYAIYAKSFRKKHEFDVTNDIYSQVYGGKDSERYRTSLAVEATEGEVLLYNDKILPAFFHASSGGHTEDASELWKISIPPLKGVISPFDQDSPHFSWKKNFRLKDIQDQLNENGHEIGLIKTIEVAERNRSGRIRELLVTARDGKTLKISGKDFRQIVGPNVIKSNKYHVVMQGYYMDLVGKGWGHGVGMDQWGARGMALKQYDYKEILQFYYPQSQLALYGDLSSP